MTTNDHIVFIVDDDARIREALTELLEAHDDQCSPLGSPPHLEPPGSG
jgi:FixJ family two-component response regulator